MSSRVITSETDRKNLLLWLGQVDLPVTVNVTKGKKRSVDQNRLQWLLINEIAEQLPDQEPEWWRAYCKLTIGVPILRAENEGFREDYDRIIRPHSFEDKIRLMGWAIDWGVTRLMNTRQFTIYIDNIYKHFTDEGLVLTVPEH